MIRKRTEEDELKAICRYIAVKYPKTIFFVDLSGLKMSKAQAGISKAMKAVLPDGGTIRIPDLIIDQPNDYFHGFRLEYKKTGERLVNVRDGYKNKAGWFSSQHIEEQFRSVAYYNTCGYCANFAIGVDDAMRQIDEYMSGRTPPYNASELYKSICEQCGVVPDMRYFMRLII